ncbi:hypothetical protein BH11ARM2_BH11ARM2_17100 [soil metagenome]
MRSGGLKKRRRRLIIEWRPILGFLLVVNVIAGLMASKVTRLTHIVVEGAPQADQARIKGILESVAGVPAAKIKGQNLESLVLDHPAVSSAELTRNIFGSGRLKVAYRQPIAARLGRPNEALSTDGVLYRTLEPSEGLPILQMPLDLPAATLTLSGGWRGKDVAGLVQELSALAGTGGVRIAFDRKGNLTAFLGGGRVELGGAVDLGRKMGVLKERLSRDPAELKKVQALVLVDPDRPVYVRLPEPPKSAPESHP